MSKISEADAGDQMRTLRMLGEAEAAMQEVEGYGLENAENKSRLVEPLTAVTRSEGNAGYEICRRISRCLK
jgi:hypothetical protein